MGSSNPQNANDIFNEFFGAGSPFGTNSPNSTSSSYTSRGFGPSGDIYQELFTAVNGGTRSSSMPKKKPPALECKLPCSLEELYSGSSRKMKISRDVVKHNGRLVQETEIISVDVKAGWKKGTKITFPDKGNEQLNQLPADLIFVIDEKPHAMYIRDGNDLVINRKLSLADALAGTTMNFKTLDGRNLLVPVTEIVTPGYELVVAGEGMPISKNTGTKGNLKIKFDVKFPTRLTPEQKRAVRRDLEG